MTRLSPPPATGDLHRKRKANHLAELERRGLTPQNAVSQQQALVEQTHRRDFQGTRILPTASAIFSIGIVALLTGIGILADYAGAHTEGAGLLLLALLAAIAILLYRHAPRVLALFVAGYFLYGALFQLSYSAFDAAVSLSSAVIGVSAYGASC